MNKVTLFIIAVLLAFTAFFYYSKTADTQDNTPPSIAATDPASGANNVSTNASIHVYFSEEMDPASITTNTFYVTDSGGTTLQSQITYANKTAAVVLFGHLDEQGSYTATVSGNVTDFAGNPLGSDYSWSFQTGEE